MSSDNTVLNQGSGGDTVRDVDRNGVKTPVVLTDIGIAGKEALWDGTDIQQYLMLSLILAELQMLRQAFQDWSGQENPRNDPVDSYNPASMQ